MKKMKTLASLVLAIVLAFALTIPAFAANNAVPSITISNASKGVTYYALKLFDAEVTDAETNAGIAYYYGDVKDVANITDTDVKAMFVGENAVFTMNSIGQITQKDDVADAAVTDAVAAWAKKQTLDASVPNGTGGGGALTISLDAGNYGYYAVISNQSEAAVTVNSTNPTVTIADKTTVDVPTLPDNAKIITSTGETYQLGDTVNYRLEVPTTNWVRTTTAGTTTEEKVYNYTLTDTSSANYLKIDTNSVNVKVKGFQTEDSTAVDLSKAATITRNENGVMTISIPWTTTENENGDSLYENRTVILVTYSATVIGTGKGSNTLTASYNGKSITGFSTEDVYNVEVSIDKYDGADETKATKLAGATFALKNNENKYYKYIAVNGTNPATVTWVDGLDDATTYTTTTSGDLETNFVGLEPGTYTLVETVAPDGYNKMTDMSIEVVGNESNSYNFEVDVPNLAGTTLPDTGGMGTTLFYTVGGLLVVCSAILFVTKKRMSNMA